MRLNKYIKESVSWSVVKNLYSKISRMSDNVLDYQLKAGWYEYVDRVRDVGKEDRMLKFINNMFHMNLESLDDVNLERLKINLQPVDESIDIHSIYQIISRMQEFISVVGISTAIFAAIVLRAAASEKD